MRKYIFIKDELYSSTLYNNYTEYISKDDDLDCHFGGAMPYKIKLMSRPEAEKLIGSHPMLLTADTSKFEPLPSCPLALVSFGGAAVTVNIGRMIRLCDSYGSCILGSPMLSTNEAENLVNIHYVTEPGIKMLKGPQYLYLSMVKLQDTDVYYLITNPTLVQAVGHIELPGDPWIEQIKGIKDTIKDSIFSLDTNTNICAGHLLFAWKSRIDFLKNSIIQPEDRKDFFKQLKFQVTSNGYCRHKLEDTSIILTKDVDENGALKIDIENKLLGNYINNNEKLHWEYIMMDL